MWMKWNINRDQQQTQVVTAHVSFYLSFYLQQHHTQGYVKMLFILCVKLGSTLAQMVKWVSYSTESYEPGFKLYLLSMYVKSLSRQCEFPGFQAYCFRGMDEWIDK